MLAYIVVIVAMTAAAILSAYSAHMLITGALLFMFSDGCVAVRRFKKDFDFSNEVT